MNFHVIRIVRIYRGAACAAGPFDLAATYPTMATCLAISGRWALGIRPIDATVIAAAPHTAAGVYMGVSSIVTRQRGLIGGSYRAVLPLGRFPLFPALTW